MLTATSTAPSHNDVSADAARIAVQKLIAYCRTNNWAGYDPYDALNSEYFKAIPQLDSKWPRLVFTQALKRSPLNIRRLVAVPPTQNPKAMALFLTAFLKLTRTGLATDDDVTLMLERIVDLRSSGVTDWSWGYSFPWQTRTQVVPRGAPNLVSTLR